MSDLRTGEENEQNGNNPNLKGGIESSLQPTASNQIEGEEEIKENQNLTLRYFSLIK